MSFRRSLIWAGGVIACIALAFVLVNLRQAVLRAKQVGTCADLQAYCSLLDRYRVRHGNYPTQLLVAVQEAGYKPEVETYLAQCKDRWGYSIHYESRGSSYVLVSFGRDGLPDGSDYWSIRAKYSSAGALPFMPCLDFNADAIASDLAVHRCCGK